MKISRPVAPTTQGASAPSSAAIITTFPEPVFTGEAGPTIIHPEMWGIVELITGFRGKGKTSFCLKTDRPENICMIDCENKGITLAKPLAIGAYFQPVSDAIGLLKERYDIQAAYDRIVQIVRKMPEGRFTTLILDNAQDLNDGASQFFRNNLSLSVRYGVRPENVISGGFGGALPAVKHLIAELMHVANAKGIKIFAITFQLKPAWKDGKPLFNQFKTTDVSIYHERSSLTLLMADPMVEYFPVPRAYVMKESLSKMWWDDKEQTTKQQRRIPPALPKAEPRFVYNYLDNPADFSNLQPGESVTALELAPFMPTFSKEQLTELERMMRAQKALGMVDEEDSNGEGNQ